MIISFLLTHLYNILHVPGRYNRFFKFKKQIQQNKGTKENRKHRITYNKNAYII